jgi:uncharacterized protein YjbI with pentapeptide repeats
VVCGKNLVRILTSGAAEWNAFRGQNPDWVMLNGACLAQSQLAFANLQRAFLMASDLNEANLEGVSLECAILRKANLRGSNLRYAKIDGADLFDANLSDADLRGASMNCCFLSHADLRGADLSTAQGLTYAQIMKAFGDDDTKLPSELPRPASWTAQGVLA